MEELLDSMKLSTEYMLDWVLNLRKEHSQKMYEYREELWKTVKFSEYIEKKKKEVSKREDLNEWEKEEFIGVSAHDFLHDDLDYNCGIGFENALEMFEEFLSPDLSHLKDME